MTLAIKLTAVSNAATVVSLTNHAYFNLNHDNSTTDNHQITVNADRYLPIQTNMIPTGELRNVDGTPFDLRQPRTMGEQRTIPHPQLELTNGFDHNFVLNSINHGLVHAATLFSPQSGLQLECRTNQPGLQLYGGQHLTPPFLPRQGICLEPQQFPDAPNQPGFPSAQLEPGEIYEHRMVLSFSIRG